MSLKGRMTRHGLSVARCQRAPTQDEGMALWVLRDRGEGNVWKAWTQVEDVFFVLLDDRGYHIWLSDTSGRLILFLLDGVLYLPQDQGLHLIVAHMRQGRPLAPHVLSEQVVVPSNLVLIQVVAQRPRLASYLEEPVLPFICLVVFDELAHQKALHVSSIFEAYDGSLSLLLHDAH